MKLTGLRWRRDYAIFLLVLTAVEIGAIRPETIMADIFTKPLVPQEWASSECIFDTAIYLNELKKYTPWALQMYDASVKIPSGLITGNHRQLGNFDECLQAKSDHGFIGQACYASVQFEIAADNGTYRELDLGDLLVNVAIASNATKWKSGNTVTYEWMWCVPSTCNHSEMQEALEIALDPLKVEGRVDMIINIAKESCHTAETVRVTWDIADCCYVSIVVLFTLIIIISTGYDIAIQRLAIKNPKVMLTFFSLYTNGKKLLQTDRNKESIRCLDGLRYLSICWIIYGHTYYMEAVSIQMNLTQIPRMHYDWSSMLVLNGNIVTDTFFLLSGFLLAYTELSKKEKRKKTNWLSNILSLYLHRYVRLTPAYAMIIGFYATLLYKFGTGPYWDAWIGSNKDFCRENWWTNLLYINNYVNVEKMCMSQSWYLSNDMQLIWLSPLILYPMFEFRTFFFTIIFGICLISSILVPFIITYTNKLTGTMLYYKEQEDVINVYLNIYIKVYNRFGPYLIGLGLGYLIHKTQCKFKLRTRYVICGWLIAIVSGLSVVYGPRNMYFDTYVYDKIEASLYAGFHRQIFAFAVSWIIFCCVNGYAGPVNYFLSWHGWLPLSKLTYCAYLTHYLFLLSNVGSVRTAGNLTSMNMIRTFFANLVSTMVLSMLWYLCFEVPFINIDRFLSYKRKQEPSEHINNKYYDSVTCGVEICRPRDESLTKYNNDNTIQSDVIDYSSISNLEITRENHENGTERAERVNEETGRRNSDQIYVISTGMQERYVARCKF